MRKKSLRTLSFALSTAMVLSVVNPAPNVLATPADDSVIEQQVTETIMEQASENGAMESVEGTMTVAEGDSEDSSETVGVMRQAAIEVVATESVEETSALSLKAEKEDEPQTQKKTLNSQALLTTIMKDATLLEMVVNAHNTMYGRNLTSATMTIADLQSYEGELDFSTVNTSVKSVAGLGAATGATGIDIRGFTSVTTIGDEEFADCQFVSFEMPATITSIGSKAFDSCTNLASITLPTGLKQIGDEAFDKCSSLAAINTTTAENTLPSGLTSIGQKAFMDNTSLTVIQIPSFTNGSVLESAIGLFSGCRKLETIIIGQNVKTIPVDAFKFAGIDGNGVTITFNSGLDKILNDAFYGIKLWDGRIDLSSCTSLSGIAAGAFREIYTLNTVILPSENGKSGTVEFGEYVFANSTLTTLYPEGKEAEGIYLPSYTAAEAGVGIFYGNEVMEKVSLPVSLSEIPDYTFDGCTSLTTVEMQGTSNATIIGDCAFRGTSITNTDFMKNMPNLLQIGRQIHEKYIVKKASELESIPLGGENYNERKDFNITDPTQKLYDKKNVGSEVFTNCFYLESVTIPSSVRVIAQRAFYSVNSISAIDVIWESAASGTVGLERKIYPEAFNYANIETMVLPQNGSETLSIGAAAFSDNSELISVGHEGSDNNTLPNTISYIGVAAFEFCTSLLEIHIQAINGSTPELSPQVFEGCYALTTASLPSQTTVIPRHFFAACPLTSFNFEDMTNLTKIDTLAFVGHWIQTIDLSNCVNLSEVGGGALAYIDRIKKNYMDDYKIVIPHAEEIAPVLEKVILPDRVNSHLYFNTAAFCSQIQFTTMGRKSTIRTGEVVIPAYAPQGSKMIFAVTGVSKVTWEADTDASAVANRWKTIGADTFEGCINIVDAKDVLPKYVENIHKRAFAGSSITGADLTEFTSLTTLSNGSLEYSTKYEGAFAECLNLESVVLPTGNQEITIEKQTFKGSSDLKFVDLGGATSLGESAFEACYGLESIYLKNVKKVNKSAFKECTNLQTINFSNVETIGDNAFELCSALTITDNPFPDTLISIGKNAFEDASLLGVVEFGSGITTIGSSAFKNAGVTELDFDKARLLSEIGTNAFEGISITKFEIAGTQVKVIPTSMLYKCMSLTDATFGEEVEYISMNAMAACPKFKNFEFFASTTVSRDVFNATATVDSVKVTTGKNNGVSAGSTNLISITVNTPAETIVPLNREVAFPYYVNEEKTSDIKYLRVYDANSNKDLTVEKYLSVKSKVESGYYKVTNSDKDGGIYKVGDEYFTNGSDVLTLANKKKVDVVKVKGLEVTESTRDLKFEIVANINFTCDDDTVAIKSDSFGATYNVKVVDVGTTASLFADSKYQIPVSNTATSVIQAVDSKKGATVYYYDLVDQIETGTKAENYNVIVETSNPDVLYAGASTSAKKQDSYTTAATTISSSGVVTTKETNKKFYLIPSGIGTATITVYPELYSEEDREKYKKTYTFTVNSDVKSISLVVPTEYKSKLYPGSEFSVFESFTNYFDQACSVGDLSHFKNYTNRTIVFESSDPSYVSVDQLGNVKILKADSGAKTVKITAKVVNSTGKSVTDTVSLSVMQKEFKKGEDATDAATGSKVTVTKTGKKDLEGEVKYVAPVTKTSTTVVVPDTVTIGGIKYKVTTVSAKAFKNNKKIKTVKIGKYVKTIEKEAFSGCTALTKVTIGNAVEKIDTKAFYNCKKLTTVTISTKSKLKTIGSNAFVNCVKLKKITLPSKVKTIGTKAFYNCKALKTITIKSTVLSSVGKQALKNIHKKAVIKVPKKKLTAYKKLLKGKGQKSTVKIKK